MKHLIFGVAINDVTEEVQNCIYYRTWKNMLKRCYYLAERKKQPTYEGYTVCDDWLYFSNFKSWMQTQDYKNKELDKDILKFNNKEYNSNTCCFVSQAVNNILKTRKASRGSLPLGVTLNSTRTRYRATVRVGGKLFSHGTFDTIEEASQAYKKAKSKAIRNVANAITDLKIQKGLLNYDCLYEKGKIL